MVRCLWNGQKERLRPERGAGGMRLPTQREALESPGGIHGLFSHAKRYPLQARAQNCRRKEKPAVRALRTAGVVDHQGLEPRTDRL